MGTCTDPWNLFSSEQVMVTILVTLVLLNLYLVLHYNVGSGLTRVFRFTTLGNWAACFNTGLMNSSSSALVTVSSNLLLVTFHSNTSSTRVLSVGWWNFSTSSFFYLISSSECIAKCAMTLRDLAIARYWFIEEIEDVEDSEETSKDTTNNINSNALCRIGTK